MKMNGIIKGKYISLRSVNLDDAEFIIKIRSDKTKNTYLHAVSNDIEKQREWITDQMHRDGDFYFVVKDVDNHSIGLASIYDIGLYKNAAEFGRWISWGNTFQNVESVILCFDFAFESLGVEYLYMRTMKENAKVKHFWKQFGAEFIGDIYEMDMWLSKSIVTKNSYYHSSREKAIHLLKYS